MAKINLIAAEKAYAFARYANIALFLSALLLTVYQVTILLRPHSLREISSRIRQGKPDILFGEIPSLPKGLPGFDESLFREKVLFPRELPAVAAVVEDKKGTLILLGISLGEKKIAIIRDSSQNKNYYCSPGGTVGDYRVKEIYKGRVVLESPRGPLELIQ
jgi:hypothetical protein